MVKYAPCDGSFATDGKRGESAADRGRETTKVDRRRNSADPVQGANACRVRPIVRDSAFEALITDDRMKCYSELKTELRSGQPPTTRRN